jgi:hypothetical protein
MNLFISPFLFEPQISDAVIAALRIGYGCLLLGLFAISGPQWNRFFLSEKWGGYARSSRIEDILQSPLAAQLIRAVWVICAIALITNMNPLLAAFTNLLICRYYFVEMRWKGVLRGMGAPGFMTYWLGFAVLLLQCVVWLAPSERSLVVGVLQIDFAFIMLSAGLYKLSAGYAVNEGMQYGLVNPEWGYWWKFYQTVKADNPVFAIMNHLAWLTEVVAAAMMLFPPTRFLGGLVIFLSFVFIRTQIRLGVLCEIVMLSCFLFFHPGSLGDVATTSILDALHISYSPVPSSLFLQSEPLVAAAVATMHVLLLTYLILLPFAHAGIFFNFYKQQRLPGMLQTLLEKYTNAFGIIIWRVFSVDVVNFFINIYQKKEATSERILLSQYGLPLLSRFSHVAESITITSLFTTLKYYCSNKLLFEERILRYARTLNCSPDAVLEFEYIRILKEDNRFVFRTIALYVVNPVTNQVTEVIENGEYSTTKAHEASPVHEGSIPGSYAPASTK